MFPIWPQSRTDVAGGDPEMAQAIPLSLVLSCLKASWYSQSRVLLLPTLPPSPTPMGLCSWSDLSPGRPLERHDGLVLPCLNYTSNANLSLRSARTSKCYALRDHIGQVQGTLILQSIQLIKLGIYIVPKIDVYLFNIRTLKTSLDRMNLPFIEHFLYDRHYSKS